MNDPQLEAGALETLDGQGNPVEKQAATSAMQAPVLEAPPEDEEVPLITTVDLDGLGQSGMDGIGDGVDPLAYDPENDKGLRPSREMLVGASGLFNVAMLDSLITPDSVEQMLLANSPTQSSVKDLIASMKTEDAEVSEMAMKSLLQNPDMSPGAKLEAIRMLHGDNTPDMYGVQRLAASNAALADYANEDEDDDTEWFEQAQAATEDMPKNVSAFEPENGTEEEQQDAVWESMKSMYSAAEDSIGVLDFVEQATPIGSLPTLNKTVSDIASALGMPANETYGQGYLAVGSAMKAMRAEYRDATPERQEEMARTVMAALKKNTGLFQDSNDLVTMMVLDNIFSEKLTGRDQWAFEASTGDRDINAEIDALSKTMYQTTKPLTPERAAIKAEINELRKARIGIGPETMIDNAFNLLDLVGVGAVGRTTLKFGTKYAPAAWKRMFKVSPATADRRMADAIENPEVAGQMGLSPADALNTALPNGGRLSRGSNALVALAERQRAAMQQLLRQARPVNLTQEERLKALGELSDEIGALTQKKLARPHVNFSTVIERPDGSGADVTAIFGKTNSRGYATLRGARGAKRDMVEEVFGFEANDKIVQWDEAAGKMVEVDPNAKDSLKGEFFIRADDTRSYSSLKNTWGSLKLGDDAVADLTFGATASRWTRGVNVFNNITQSWINTRARSAASARALGLGLIKPIADLPFEKKQFLAKIVKDNEGKVLSLSDLQAQGADDAVSEAYLAFRTMDDGIYEGLDYTLRNDKFRKGLKDVIVDGQRAGFAKPYERLSATNVADELVFDPELGTATRMSKADIAQLYDSAGQLGRLEYPIDVQGGVARHVLLSGKKTRVLPLPQRGVLPRIPGHYPHISQGNFVVYGVKNGVRKALKLAATESDAAEYVARRSAMMASRGAKGKGTAFDRIGYELDASLQQPEAFAAKLDEVIVNQGGVLFGKRDGGFLGNLSQDFGATSVDPIAALLKGFDIASQTVTKGELISTMKQRLHNFLRMDENKNLFIGSDTPAERLSIDNINKSFSNVKARDTAIAYAKQIEVMERTPDAWRQATRTVYNRMAHTAYRIGANRFVAKLGLKKGTRKIEQMASNRAREGANPVNSFMSMMHGLYIAIPAARQFVMNVAQTSMATSLHPGAAAASWRQFSGLSPAIFARIRYLHGGKAVFDDGALAEYSKQVSKAVGLPAAEAAKLVDTLVDSGLIDAVSHNSMIKEAISEASAKAMTKRASATEGTFGAIGRGASAAGRVAKAPINFLSQVGFQAGENINQIVSFLHLYNADRAKGIADLASDAYVDSLVGRTAELTGNMITDGAPEYTRSIFKPLFQWLQFAHKMVLLGLPKSVGGSSMFTGVEKARMAFVQFLLYGSQATALTAVGHKLVERFVVEKLEQDNPEDAGMFAELWRSDMGQQVMDGIMFDYTANKVLQALFGEADEEWNEFAWSKTMAPGGSVEFLHERLIGLFSMNPEDILGVQGKTVSNLWNYGQQISEVAQAQWKGLDDTPFEVRAEQLLKRGGATLLSPYNKYLANSWAREHDMRMGAGGKISEGFGNDLEAFLNTSFGIETKDRVEFFAARDRIDGEFSKNAGDHVADIAETYWQNLIANSTKFAAEAPSEDIYDELLRNYTNDQGLLLSALGRRDKEAVNQIIAAKLQAAASGDGTTSEAAFVQKIATKLEAGGFGSKGPEMANYLRHLDFIKDNPQFSVPVQNAWEEIMNEPTPENLSTNEVKQ